MAGTATDYIAQLDARLGKPYSETIDGGVGPDYYDCSGLTEVCLNAIGIPYTRSTYTQWSTDRARYQHFPAEGFFAFGAELPPLEIGDVLYIHVNGEADPGHVGTYVGDGQYLNAPHTTAFVRIEAIPNTSGEHVYGIIRPPFGTPAPPPPPPPTQEVPQLMSTVKTENGDLVSIAITTPSAHLVEITRRAGNQGLTTADGLSIIDFTVQWPQFTAAEIKDVTIAENGDIVAHVMTSAGHYCEVTRRAGYEGMAATATLPDGTPSVSIEDFTAAFPQFDIEP